MSFNIYGSTWRNIPEDVILEQNRRENHQSYIVCPVTVSSLPTPPFCFKNKNCCLDLWPLTLLKIYAL